MKKEKADKRDLLPRIVSIFLKRFRKDRPFVLPDDLTSAGRMLLIDSGDVTDLLFVVPVINWFHENCPEIKTTLLVEDKHADIARSMLRVNTLITYEKKQLKLMRADYMALARKLHKQWIDKVIVIGRQMSLERHLLAFLCGARTRIGFANPMAFPFINCEIRVSDEKYIGNGMYRILESLGLGIKDFNREVVLPSSDVGHARQLIHFRKPEKDLLTLGIDPGRGKTRHNVIPEIMIYLANNLAGRLKVKFLILTYPWDQKLFETYSSELKSEVIDLVPTNQAETLALLSNCDLFLSGNTDLFHFAAALHVPTIGIFTKYDEKKWIPEDYPNVRIFKGVKGEKLSLKNFFSKVEEVLARGDTVSV